MLVHHVGFHEWYAFELVIVNGCEQRWDGRVEEALVHIFELVLAVWDGVHVESCVIGLLRVGYLDVHWHGGSQARWPGAGGVYW